MISGNSGYGSMHIYPSFQESKEYTSITPHIKNEKEISSRTSSKEKGPKGLANNTSIEDLTKFLKD